MRESGKRTPWARPLADLVGAAIGPVLMQRGFGNSSLILFWNEIAGEQIAAVSRPIRVQWPPRPRSPAAGAAAAPAALTVRVEPGFALDFQHLAPVLIERVNAHLGWRCIARLKIEQGPVREAAPRRCVRDVPKAAEEAAEALAGKDIEEPLREALRRLGARVLAGS